VCQQAFNYVKRKEKNYELRGGEKHREISSLPGGEGKSSATIWGRKKKKKKKTKKKKQKKKKKKKKKKQKKKKKKKQTIRTGKRVKNQPRSKKK